MKKPLVFFIAALILVFPMAVGSANACTWNSEDDGEASIAGSYYRGIGEYRTNTLLLGENCIVINQGATATGSMYVWGYATSTGSVTGTIYWYLKGDLAGGGVGIFNAWIHVKFQALDMTTNSLFEKVVLDQHMVWSDEGTWRWDTMDIPLYSGHHYRFSLWAEVHAEALGAGSAVADFGGIWWSDSKIQWGSIDVPNMLPVPSHTLSISSGVGGTTNPAPGTHMYDEGTVVSVHAIPNEGYAFSYWMIDGIISFDNHVSITMNTDHSITYLTFRDTSIGGPGGGRKK